MRKKIIAVSVLLFSIIIFSFFTNKKPSPADLVKNYYLTQTQLFINDLEKFKKSISLNNSKAVQNSFLASRNSYKKAEALIEYYFNFYAIQLNGAPIPYFEEDDPDTGQLEPAGMQIIEALIFPLYNQSKKTELLEATNKLITAANTMLQTNESFAFNDEYIIDAVIEELYRITALGVAGFDAQLSFNGLNECKAALAGVQNILTNYKEN